MLSGGTSSLIGAPNATMSIAELSDLNEVLLASGIDIAAMNIVRKRVSRWGGGRLALALEPAQVRVFGISDVPGNDLAALGSGPLVPDETTTEDVRALLRMKGLWMRIPAVVRELLVRDDETSETPKADNPAFRHVTTKIIASNATAVNAALQRASALGYRSSLANAPLSGPAAAAGKVLARELLDAASSGSAVCLVSGGETVVDLTNRPHNAMGGRSQELALAAAAELARGGALQRLALLAAGTDGRDGPTDAAGALVTPATWRAITAAGRDPERDLLVHDAYRALDAAGALMRTGVSGTNVMDIAIGVAR
jgi:hydroxypyruvate reductase